MSTLRDQLEAGDPIASEPPLPDVEAARMRSAMLRASEARRERRSPWTVLRWAAAPAALAAGFALTSWLGQRPADPQTPADVRSAIADLQAGPRQLQFVTPRGTRVIWTFNPKFDATGVNR